MLILDELPFSIVEKEGFIQFCKEMQPKFHVVSRPTITKDCYQIFQEEREELKKYLREKFTRVSITTDMWTSIQNLGYIVLTAHYVDKDWILRKKILNFRVLPHPHKGEVIAKAVEGCLEKIMSITLDNAKSNDTCIVDLKKRLNKRNMLLRGGEFFHVRCFAHIMNLVVRDGIDEIKSSIKHLRRSVKYVKSGPSRLQMFKHCVEEEKVTSKKNVCLDVKTRWNSTYHMLDAALPFEKAFDRFEEQDPSFKNELETMGTLESYDWVQLKNLHTFLKEFYLLTDRISTSHNVSSHTYFDEVTNVKVLLTRELGSNDYNRVSMAMKMNEKFGKYCEIEKLNPILLVSVVLDPRNKVEYLELWYDKLLEYDPLLTMEKRKKEVEKFSGNLMSFMSRLYECYKLESTICVEVESFNVDGGLARNDCSIVSDVRDEIRAKLKRKSTSEAVNDLERYLSDGIEDDCDDFNILGWWKGKLATYRGLAIMARDIFSIPITSVASECAFSSAGRVLDPFRSSLTPKLVECLVCAQDWLRNLHAEDEENDTTLLEIEKVLKNFKNCMFEW